jgi:hypothetical protein
MTRLRALASGLWEFVVGEDWRAAVGVVVGLALTAILANAGAPAWWVMPVVVLGLLAFAVRRAARSGETPHADR